MLYRASFAQAYDLCANPHTANLPTRIFDGVFLVGDNTGSAKSQSSDGF